jgi:hypothetical protein
VVAFTWRPVVNDPQGVAAEIEAAYRHLCPAAEQSAFS